MKQSMREDAAVRRDAHIVYRIPGPDCYGVEVLHRRGLTEIRFVYMPEMTDGGQWIRVDRHMMKQLATILDHLCSAPLTHIEL